ncbi:MAG: TIGR03560 family F420-dependent LLM class oxidoreductase [Chloroflexota bacterium]|nr:TIGR03560 family F420-dependent LLM class oxidoreductase [Chloroflexota bacterium]
MLDVAIMIEGQDGLNWPRWQRLVRAAEDLGFAGIYRSDHFTNPNGPVRDALELWASFTWLAGNTTRISFGSLVSPISFRHPVMTAWQACAVDALACGRLRLGLGAGWQEREHTTFGFDLLETDARFARFQEGLEVITQLLRQEEPVTFDGRYYRLQAAQLMPRSPRQTGPPITIGGAGPRRTLPLVAKYADEWNAVSLPPDQYRERSRLLDDLLTAAGRDPASVRRTMMTRGAIAATAEGVQAKLGDRSAEELRARGAIVGTPSEAVPQLTALAEVGVQGVMLQWMEMDDITNLEVIAAEVLPQLR